MQKKEKAIDAYTLMASRTVAITGELLFQEKNSKVVVRRKVRPNNNRGAYWPMQALAELLDVWKRTLYAGEYM